MLLSGISRGLVFRGCLLRISEVYFFGILYIAASTTLLSPFIFQSSIPRVSSFLYHRVLKFAVLKGVESC